MNNKLYFIVNGYHFRYQADKHQAKYIFFTAIVSKKRDFHEFRLPDCHFLINLQSNCAAFMGSDVCKTNNIRSNVIFIDSKWFLEKSWICNNVICIIRFEGVGSAFTDHSLTKQNFAHDGEGNRATRYAFC